MFNSWSSYNSGMSSFDQPPVTGDEMVDEALRKVADLGEVDVGEHPQVFREAEGALQEFLRSGADAS